MINDEKVLPLDSIKSIVMIVIVNEEKIELNGTTVADLAAQMNLPEKGVAVAVAKQMVPRSEWPNCKLQEGAEIIVIRAASGG